MTRDVLDDELGDGIRDAVTDLDIPNVDLSSRVVATLTSTRRPVNQERSVWTRRLSLAAVAAAIVLGVLVTVPPTRSAMASWLGITTVTVTPVDERTDIDRDVEPVADDLGPTVPGAPTIEPIPALGQPDEVSDDATLGRSYLWRTDETDAALPGTDVHAVLSVAPVDGGTAFGKIAFVGDIEEVQIDGAVEAIWVSADHQLADSDPLLSGPALLWIRDGIRYRLEVADSKVRAVELAETVTLGTDLLPAG